TTAFIRTPIRIRINIARQDGDKLGSDRISLVGRRRLLGKRYAGGRHNEEREHCAERKGVQGQQARRKLLHHHKAPFYEVIIKRPLTIIRRSWKATFCVCAPENESTKNV